MNNGKEKSPPRANSSSGDRVSYVPRIDLSLTGEGPPQSTAQNPNNEDHWKTLVEELGVLSKMGLKPTEERKKQHHLHHGSGKERR